MWNNEPMQEMSKKKEKLPPLWKCQHAQGYGDEDWLTGSSQTGNQCLCTLRRQCSRFFSLFLSIPPRGKKVATMSFRLARNIAGWWPCSVSEQAERKKRAPFDLFHTNNCLFHTEALFWCISVSRTAHNWTSVIPTAFTLINQPAVDFNPLYTPEQRVRHSVLLSFLCVLAKKFFCLIGWMQ